MNNQPIGVFDSGVGGLTAVRELQKQMPHENIIYFGDTGRVPYGTRSKETLLKFTSQIARFLTHSGAKALIAACGTISSALDDKFLAEMGIDVPYTGMILPATRTACAMSAGGRIGVIATPAAIRTGAYGRAVRAISPTAKVFGNACPLLVPLVENGMLGMDNQITRLTLEMYLAPLIREDIDTLILGCTHYPLLYDIINDILEYKVTLIDASAPAVVEMQRELLKRDLLNSGEETGTVKYCVTDSAESFESVAKMFLKGDISGKVERVPLEEIDY